jgi:CheY-like chemotaxis protein
LVGALGGELSVTSQVGEGSTFTVMLPLIEASGNDLPAQPEETGLSGERSVLTDGQSCTILIADDRQTNRDVLHGMLIAAGFNTVLASDGDEALDLLRQHPEVSLVLMDMRMPRVSGLEALRQIHADERLRRLKVIAVTASVYPAFKQQALDAGFDDFLGKPFRIDELLEKLKKHLGVEFQSLPLDTSEPPPDQAVSPDDVRASVPADTLDRLRQALAIKNLTAIKTVADDLSAGPGTSDVGKRIHTLVRTFDFKGLDELVQELEQKHGSE